MKKAYNPVRNVVRKLNPNYKRQITEHNAKRRLKPNYKQQHKAQKLRKYGLTLEDFGAMVIQQKGLCACCGELPTSVRGLCVDHNHSTGKVRGLLCLNCNTALGHLKEDVTRCYKMIQYILSNVA